MTERMWLRATCAALVLFAAPGLAAAQTKREAYSGPFRIYIGLDDFGDPAYANCGELALYKNGAGNREWRLENTCDELIDLLVDGMPTPTPTPTPTGTTITPTPRVTNSQECPDGNFSRVSSTHFSLTNVTLQLGKTHAYCVDLPAKAFPFFELYTINKGNSSCSDLEMNVIPPSGRAWSDSGPAPVVRPNVEAGKWRVELTLHEGCARYDFHIAY